MSEVKSCNYWIDCNRPAVVAITYKRKSWVSTEHHRWYLCSECRKTIKDNLPDKSFDFKEELL